MNSDLPAELARHYYSEDLAYANGDRWIRTRLFSFLTKKKSGYGRCHKPGTGKDDLFFLGCFEEKKRKARHRCRQAFQSVQYLSKRKRRVCTRL